MKEWDKYIVIFILKILAVQQTKMNFKSRLRQRKKSTKKKTISKFEFKMTKKIQTFLRLKIFAEFWIKNYVKVEIYFKIPLCCRHYLPRIMKKIFGKTDKMPKKIVVFPWRIFTIVYICIEYRLCIRNGLDMPLEFGEILNKNHIKRLYTS